MKILLLSVLAVAMIGVMVPSAFAEEIEISLDTKKDVYTIDSDLVFSVQVSKIIPDSKVTLIFFPKSYDPVNDIPSQFPYQVSGYPKQENDGKIDFVINSFEGDWSRGYPSLKELAFEGLGHITTPEGGDNGPSSTDYVVQAIYGDSNDPFAIDTIEFELQYRISDESNYIQENYLRLSKIEIGSDWDIIDYEYRLLDHTHGTILKKLNFHDDKQQCTIFDSNNFVSDTCDAVTGIEYYKDGLSIAATILYFDDGSNPYFGKPSNWSTGMLRLDEGERDSRAYNCDESSEYFERGVNYYNNPIEFNSYNSALHNVCTEYEKFSNFECSRLVSRGSADSGSAPKKFICENESFQIFLTHTTATDFKENIIPTIKYLSSFMTQFIEKIESNPGSENTTIQDTTEDLQKIPEWVKNIFTWFSQDQISEDEVLNAIKFLVNQGIIDLDG